MKIYYLYPVTTKPANHETLKLAPVICSNLNTFLKQKMMGLDNLEVPPRMNR